MKIFLTYYLISMIVAGSQFNDSYNDAIKKIPEMKIVPKIYFVIIYMAISPIAFPIIFLAIIIQRNK